MLKRLLLLSVLCLTFFSLYDLKAEDTTVVQVLTFDNISTRDTIAHFPDGSKDYRKILMYYRLKCDPRTTWDRFNCGEWDYLTYTTLHFPTGVMDSTKKTYNLYKVKGAAPETIEIGTEPVYTTYQKYEYSAVRAGGKDGELFQFTGENVTDIIPGEGQNTFKYQFPYGKKEIKNMGHGNSAKFSNLRLFAKTSGKIKNFTIRVGAPGKLVDGYYATEKMTEVFRKREVVFAEGMNEFIFNETIKWAQVYNLVIEISGEKAEDAELPTLEGFEDSRGLFTNEVNGYYEFDGGNDYITGGERPNLAGVSQFTFEAWVKIDEWKEWTNLMTLGDKICIQTGNSVGQLYAIMRSKKDETSYNNLHGNSTAALSVGKWAHVAMVFDGTQSSNKERLKLYINGVKKTLSFNGNIPAKTYVDPQELRIGQNKLIGGMDEVRIFNTAVSQETIVEMMNKTESQILASHPSIDNLLEYYSFNEVYGGDATKVLNVASEDEYALNIGMPAWRAWDNSINPLVSTAATSTFKMEMQEGKYDLTVEKEMYEERVFDELASIHTYYEEDKTVKENKDAIRFAYLAGWRYTYSPEGKKVDSTYFKPTETLTNEEKVYYLDPYEVVDHWEIARYITPYGINFDLGPDGFLWVYDVTDYANKLQGDVSITAHNTQELIDLKFLFIEGTPPRDVVSIERPWGPKKSLKYRDMDNDVVLKETEFELSEGVEQIKLITRLTGHGHEKDKDESAHCCEWKTNTHTLHINGGEERLDWLIWRDDCGVNPIGHQGGTWPLSREGWCPGDLVRDTEFELTEYVKDNKITLDYSITPVPKGNQGMGNGNYITSMHMVQYGETNFDKDVEIYQIISPNNWQTYANRSLLCDGAQIVVRNNGKEDVTSLNFEYYVTGAEDFSESYTWSGKLAPHRKDTITLPVTNDKFWLGTTNPEFHVEIDEVMGGKDDYAVNDKGMTYFTIPEMFEETIYFELKTNSRGAAFSYSLEDIDGNKIFNRPKLQSNTIYRDTIQIDKSNCYMLQLEDIQRYGLSVWFINDPIKGYLNIYNEDGTILKRFDPDCGQGYLYPFNMGEANYVHDAGFDELLTVSPIPCDNELNVDFHDMFGQIEIEVFDVNGKRVMKECAVANASESVSLDTSRLPAGFYYITISNGEISLKQRFIKE